LLPVDAGIGPHPTLPEPQTALIPTVNVVDAKGWADDAAPTPASSLRVTAFARAGGPATTMGNQFDPFHSQVSPI
jgi:hypothetical protein